MPLTVFLRAAFSLVSLALLALAAGLLWTWWRGEWIGDPQTELVRVREEWRLWTGLALLAWSFLGRPVVSLLLARKDPAQPSRFERGAGDYYVGASGAQLYVESQGKAGGPTLVFTHGWGLDSTIWSYAKRDLAKVGRLVFWDLPGLGRSKAPPAQEVSLANFAADLGSVIELAGDGPVVLVGHSIGGMTIQTLARDNPELFARKVAGVVLLNTTYTNPLRTMILSPLACALRRPLIEPMMRLTIWLQPLAWLSAWQSYLSGSAHMANRLGFGRFVTRSQLEHVTLLATRNPPGVQARGNLAMFRWDALEALPGMTCPVLVIGGDIDIVTRLEASETIAKTLPDARLQVVAGVNHMGFLERADLYNTAIRDFVERVTSEQRPRAEGQNAAGIVASPT